MSSCCSSAGVGGIKTNKLLCVSCGEPGVTVGKKTILQHIKSPWLRKLDQERYFFCQTTNCDAVYFSANGEVVIKKDLRTQIGIKEKNDEALICYCFGVNKTVAATDKSVKEFVVAQTKKAVCACETANPSGRCCLKDFPKF